MTNELIADVALAHEHARPPDSPAPSPPSRSVGGPPARGRRTAGRGARAASSRARSTPGRVSVIVASCASVVSDARTACSAGRSTVLIIASAVRAPRIGRGLVARRGLEQRGRARARAVGRRASRAPRSPARGRPGRSTAASAGSAPPAVGAPTATSARERMVLGTSRTLRDDVIEEIPVRRRGPARQRPRARARWSVLSALDLVPGPRQKIRRRTSTGGSPTATRAASCARGEPVRMTVTRRRPAPVDRPGRWRPPTGLRAASSSSELSSAAVGADVLRSSRARERPDRRGPDRWVRIAEERRHELRRHAIRDARRRLEACHAGRRRSRDASRARRSWPRVERQPDRPRARPRLPPRTPGDGSSTSVGKALLARRDGASPARPSNRRGQSPRSRIRVGEGRHERERGRRVASRAAGRPGPPSRTCSASPDRSAREQARRIAPPDARARRPCAIDGRDQRRARTPGRAPARFAASSSSTPDRIVPTWPGHAVVEREDLGSPLDRDDVVERAPGGVRDAALGDLLGEPECGRGRERERDEPQRRSRRGTRAAGRAAPAGRRTARRPGSRPASDTTNEVAVTAADRRPSAVASSASVGNVAGGGQQERIRDREHQDREQHVGDRDEAHQRRPDARCRSRAQVGDDRRAGRGRRHAGASWSRKPASTTAPSDAAGRPPATTSVSTPNEPGHRPGRQRPDEAAGDRRAGQQREEPLGLAGIE